MAMLFPFQMDAPDKVDASNLLLKIQMGRTFSNTLIDLLHIVFMRHLSLILGLIATFG